MDIEGPPGRRQSDDGRGRRCRRDGRRSSEPEREEGPVDCGDRCGQTVWKRPRVPQGPLAPAGRARASQGRRCCPDG